MKFTLSDSLRAVALSGIYHDELLPRAVAAESDADVRDDVLELLQSSELIDLTTLCPSGWPATHCMHFCTVEAGKRRPIIYMSTKASTRKINNVRKNARVSLALYRGFGFEGRRKARGVQLQAICSVVDDPAELQFALDEMRRKTGYGFTSLLDLEGQSMLRAEPVFALWQDNSRRPQRCTIDYRGALANDQQEGAR